MAYEVDFVGSTKAAKDYDAVAFRYKTAVGKWVTCVFDGGTSDAGADLVEHLRNYYVGEGAPIDVIFCSHPDLDHASGLKQVLEEFPVHFLVMNRPWEYLDDLFERVKDGRITKQSLEKTLREKYQHISDLEKIAKSKGCTILQGIVGENLGENLQILSPTKEFYIQCLADSEKTPVMESAANSKHIFSALNTAVKTMAKWLKGIWGTDAIREGENTTPDNESSIILRVCPPNEKPFLFVGDAGCKGLTAALDLADTKKIPLNTCDFLQVPHHGGRHNVSPSVLNRLIGAMVEEGTKPTKTAFVSVCKDSDHPRKCVVNAFLNRGCSVFATRGQSKHHFRGDVPTREGWIAATAEPFSERVESWDG